MSDHKEDGESQPLKRKESSSKAKLYSEIMAALDGLNPNHLPLADKFHVTEPEPGRRLLLRETAHEVVRHVADDALAGAILRYCNQSGNVRFMVTMAQAREISAMWIHMATPVPDPKPISALSERGLTYHRLPFDPADGPCPLFEEFLGRCSNSPALTIFVGSLFDPLADRQQYVWLQGRGGDGKGAFMRLLERLLGPAYHSDMVPDGKHGPSRFWTSAFLGKRLVCFPDTNSPSFPATQLFKSLTGGDSARIEAKFKDTVSVPLICKFLFGSNEQPIISSCNSDRRRLIYSFVGPITGRHDPDYEENLWDEAPQILWHCMDAYRKHCGARALIPIEGDLTDLSDIHDARYEALFYEHFETTQDSELDPVDRGFVEAADVVKVLGGVGITNTREVNKYIEFWKRALGVSEYRPSGADGKRAKRRYLGMRRKALVNVVQFESRGKYRRGAADD